MDRKERLRFLLRERQVEPWRERLRDVLTSFNVPVVLVTPPEADPLLEVILGHWHEVRDEPYRVTHADVGGAAIAVAARLSAAAGEVWVLPGPEPQVGVLRMQQPPETDLVASLIAWNRDGCIFYDVAGSHIVLADYLDGAVEVQTPRETGEVEDGST